LGKTHLIISDQHSHYQHSNRRAEWLGRLILDVKPDVVINIGDCFDMPSLSGYDKGKRSFQGRTYKADIDAGIDFNDRLWGTVRKAKTKLPARYFFVGNHEQRIPKAIELQPELDGTIGFHDLHLSDFYDEVIGYEGSAPGSLEIDGVTYAHYFISGIMGRSISGEHHATSLLNRHYQSLTCGHSHLADLCFRTTASGRKIIGCVAGVYQDYISDWCGKEVQKLWWPGVVIKRDVENGVYNPQFISLKDIKREYA
jgi:hypothetical protein